MRSKLSWSRSAVGFFLVCAMGLTLTVTASGPPLSPGKEVYSLTASVSGDSGPYLHLAAGSFDPLAPSVPPHYPAELMLTDYSGDGPGYYIVQFDSPITESRKAALSGQGARIFDYIPDYAFVVKMDRATRAQVERSAGVRWVGLYQPAYRIAPALLSKDLSSVGVRELVVLTFPDEDQVLAQLRAMGGEVLEQSQTARRGRLKMRIDVGQVGAIAALSGVRWIEAAPAWQLFNDKAADLMNARDVWDTHGLYGAGQTVAVCDSGLDQGSASPGSLHDDFEDGSGSSRVVALYDLVGDGASDVNSGHGTHVAGSVLGNGVRSGATPSSHSYPSTAHVGLAPEASLVFQAVENNTTGQLGGIPWDLDDLFSQAQGDGAYIHTNSWGADDDGAYSSYSEDVDDYIWNHRNFTILFAAGNQGTDANSNGVVDLDSIGSPGTAKNCITVGASENNRPTMSGSYGANWPIDFPANPINGDWMADDPVGMVAFSSRGPTDDGRYKPDLVAPGTFVASVRSSLASEGGWGVIDSYYMYMGGTSMATPLTAGAATLVRQFYTTQEGITPSAALIKATLINGATDLSPGQYGTGGTQEIPDPPRPNNVEGWGRVNVENSIFPASPRILQYTDYITGLNTSDVATYVYKVTDSSEPLRVTLVWSDYPGTPEANGGLVNDLNLTVTGPTGLAYYPVGAQQRAGNRPLSPMADNVNNVEGVDIDSPAVGTYTIQVQGANVAHGPQPFALVVSGSVSPEELNVTAFRPIKAPDNAVLDDAVVSGTGFEDTAAVHLLKGAEIITGTAATVDTDAGTITADFELNGATIGWWDVRVANTVTDTATLTGALYVVDSTLPDLGISKTTGESEVEPGSLLTYIIVITNSGYVTATGVVFTDTLPGDVTFKSLTPATNDGTLSMTVGAKVEYTLVVSVSTDAEGTLTNQVVVGSNETDGYSYDNSGQVGVQVSGESVVYLPFLVKDWPLLPPLPSTLESVGDACILEGYPTTNVGDTVDMWVGYDDYLNPDGRIVRSFVKFDLSEIRAGTRVSDATFHLYLNASWDYPGRSRTITIYRVGSSWSESSVTWNMRPSIAEAYGSASVTHGNWTWYTFDVTALLQGWIDGTWPNYGLAIRGPEHSGSDSSWKSFYTRESSSSPYITITYSTQVAQGAVESVETGPEPEPAGPTISDLLGSGE